jgi:hypothetical protein
MVKEFIDTNDFPVAELPALRRGANVMQTPPGLAKWHWHTGEVFASLGAPAGSTVVVWTDQTGHLTGRPLPRSAPAAREFFAAAMTVVVMALVLACAGTAARRMVDHRRLAAWEADWAVTEPRWTTRR